MRLESLDLKMEKAVQNVVLAAIKQGLVKSAHDCSEGGLAVALAECCVTGKAVGARVSIEADVRTDALLFGESQSRVIVSCSKEDAGKIMRLCEDEGVTVAEIGEVGGYSLLVNNLIDVKADQISDVWKHSIDRKLRK